MSDDLTLTAPVGPPPSLRPPAPDLTGFLEVEVSRKYFTTLFLRVPNLAADPEPPTEDWDARREWRQRREALVQKHLLKAVQKTLEDADWEPESITAGRDVQVESVREVPKRDAAAYRVLDVATGKEWKP